MPELPEVETTVRGLQSKVLQGTFVDVWSDWPKMVKRPKRFTDFRNIIQGKRILRVWRRAKNVIFDVSDGYSLLIHMKMTGHLLVGRWVMQDEVWQSLDEGPLRERINGFLHILFFLKDGRMIALSDMRKFAKVELWKTQDLLQSPEFLKLGPEPLEKSFTFSLFQERLHSRRGAIKQLLMKPDFIAGIGNIYANEALWLAKIHPQRDVAGLVAKEEKTLYLAIRNVLSKGIALGGDSFSDYRNVDGEEGTFDAVQRVYQRQGKPCYRCKTKIQKIVLGGRGTFFCPKCQK